MVTQQKLDAVFERYPKPRREHLIPIMQEVQDQLGYLSQEAIIRIGQRLRLPVSKVYGVATFYNQFRFQAHGKFHIQVCRGTACHVKGSARILGAIMHALKIEPDQTTRDGLFSLEVVACIGTCGLAPAITVNGEVHAAMTPDGVRKLLRRYAKENERDCNGD